MKKSVRGALARPAAVALVAASAPLLIGAPAHAAASISVDVDGKGAVIDKTYSTTLTVSGKGFQSVKGGHGGIYVWFGTVKGDWKPSEGGKSGVDYVYVPDSEAKDNAGFQRYVAFPGSNTSSAANGGTMDAKGNWSTELVVPGPKFEAVGRNGSTTVDCRKVTCGIITIGAHGVRNGNNETFTPVKLVDLYGGEAPSTGQAQGSGAATPTPTSAGTPTTVPTSGSTPATKATDKKGKPAAAALATLSVDHAAAVAGRAMSFTASNLVPGEQFTVVLNDGAAAAGPFAAGEDGRASGVIQLPREIGAGTHGLRLFGSSVEVSVKFGVQSDDDVELVAGEKPESVFTPANVFAGVAGLVFVAAVALSLFRFRGGRRAQA